MIRNNNAGYFICNGDKLSYEAGRYFEERVSFLATAVYIN